MVRVSLGDGIDFDLIFKDSGDDTLQPNLFQSGGEVCIDVSNFAGKITIRKARDVVEEGAAADDSDEEETATENDVPPSTPGQTFEEVYSEGKQIGEGAFSKVHIATHRSANRDFVVKIVDRSKSNWNGRDALKDEVDNLQALKDAPHVVRLQDVFFGDALCRVVLEYVPGGELFERIIQQGIFTEKEARDSCKCVLKGLEFMHEKRIAHRDIKPENLMLFDTDKLNSVRISDFGFSKMVQKRNSCTTLCGTPGYLAPEVLERWPAYDVACDMWSFGCTLFLLLGGYAALDPNGTNDTDGIFESTRNGKYHFFPERWNNISQLAKDLVAQCLNIHPNKRVTARKALRHEWMTANVGKGTLDASRLKSMAQSTYQGRDKKARRENLKKDFNGFMDKRRDSIVSHMTGSHKTVATAATKFKGEGSSGRPINVFYKKGDKLGKGAFATVHRCRHQETGLDYAVKEMDISGLSDRELMVLQGEITVLKYVRGGPSIIRLFDVYREPKRVHLVMEEMKGGDVLGRIVQKECYTEFEARDTCKHFFEAVRYCHRKRIAHRDIKLENLLLVEKNNESTVKLADFGFAKKCPRNKGFTTMCGTPNYMAPEVFELPACGYYDFGCDMWSVGVSVYCLLGGYLPFEGNDVKAISKKVLKGKYKFHDEYWGSVSIPAKEMISRMLQRRPEKRLSAEEAMTCEWMGMDVDQLTIHDLSVCQKKHKATKFKDVANKVKNLNKLGLAVPKSDDAGASKKATAAKTREFRDVGKQIVNLRSDMDALAKMEALEQVEDDEEEKFIQNYEILQKIGEGEFAEMHIAIHRHTNSEVAVKKVCRQNLIETDVVALDDEIAVMRAVSDSEHVVRLKEVYEDPDYTHIVMERVYGTVLIEDLVKKKRYTEFDAKEVVRNLLLGVHHCHSKKVAIRNLKLESLLLPDDDTTKVRITDFECAKFVTFPNSLHTQCGTQEYVAPEVLENKPAYDVSCDMWTVGIVVFIMVGGYYPFRAKNEDDVMKKIRYGEFKFHSKFWKNISDDAKTLVKQMMTVMPDERITAAEALSSPWIHQSEKRLSSIDLSGNISALAGDLAKRKVKAAAKTILAMNKLKGLRDIMYGENLDDYF